MTEDQAQLGNELEQLAAEAIAAHDQTWMGGANHPYSPEVLAAHDALRDRIVAAGYAAAVAREAVANWVLLGRSRDWSVLESIAWTIEHRPANWPTE